MTNTTRNSLIASIAFGLALAAPASFAQSQTTATQDPAAATEQAAAQVTDPAVGAATQSAQPQQATGAKQGWEEVDTDKDGEISKDEASANASLSQIFAQADADNSGKLTKDEYKAFVEKNYADKPQP